MGHSDPTNSFLTSTTGNYQNKNSWTSNFTINLTTQLDSIDNNNISQIYPSLSPIANRIANSSSAAAIINFTNFQPVTALNSTMYNATDAAAIFSANNGSSSAGSGNDTDEDVQSIMLATQVVAYSELVFAILGPPMQLFVLFLGTNVYRRTGQTSQLVVLSMTCGDLLVSSIHSPMIFGWFGLHQAYSYFPCVLMFMATYIGCIASSLSLLLLNVDKFIYLSKPLHYHMMVTGRKTGICIGACWVITVAWTLLIIFGPATNFMPKGDGDCSMDAKNIGVYISFLFVFLSLPSMISFAISLHIRYLVNRHRNKDEKLQREMSTMNGASTAMSQRTTSRRSHVVSSLRSIAFVFSATIWTCCTVLPYRIGYVIHNLNKQDASVSSIILLLTFFILLSLNPVGNPIIIISTQRLYIQFIRKHASKIFGWQSEYETPTVMTRTETGSICYNY